MNQRDRMSGTGGVLIAALLWGTTGTAATFAPEVSPVAIGAVAMGVGGLLQALIALRGIIRSRVSLRQNGGMLLTGALAVGSELMARYGTESYIGRCAAVMLGCTETTFYTVAVYFGAAGIQRTRYAIPAALCADAVGFLAAAWAVRWMMCRSRR